MRLKLFGPSTLLDVTRGPPTTCRCRRGRLGPYEHRQQVSHESGYSVRLSQVQRVLDFLMKPKYSVMRKNREWSPARTALSSGVWTKRVPRSGTGTAARYR